ncbi:transporter [Natrialba sp. PRR66]|uniref:transporter n=1 Tax=Natrialba sp. PRR66 TaxID=3098146 RepID=UPI002B1E7ECA|nr:transporter [Natrialba sp. PRR66]
MTTSHPQSQSQGQSQSRPQPRPRPPGGRFDPVRIVLLVTLVTSHGLIRVAERYFPEFLSALGYGPIVAGLLVSTGLGVAVVVTASATAGLNSGDEAETGDRNAETRSHPVRVIAVVSVLLATLGLFVWTGAPTLDTLLGTPLSALGWLAVGVVLLQAWHSFGPVRTLWPTDTRIVGRKTRSARTEADEFTPSGAGRAHDARADAVVGALGIGAGALVVTAAIAIVGGVKTGFSIVAATGAAVTLVAAITRGVVGETDRLPLVGRTEAPSAARSRVPDSVASVRRAIAALPDRRRWTITGDALVRLALVGSTPYLVLLFVEEQPLSLSVGGRSLMPAALFGAFVLAEAGGALLGAIAAPRLVSAVDRRWLLTLGLAGVSLVPMALVATSSVAIVALLFAVLGCRTAIEPLRPTVGPTTRPSHDVSPDADATALGLPPPEPLQTAVRVALVPAPFVGGLLYAIHPVAAFTVATTVSLLGVRELLRSFSFERAGD